ncbi:MAG TPA: hypothetical protein VGO22_18720 [Pseudorhizobium sp.]|jgi:hypothetical protein|nr:hypothetical protein [Pseudorhizobium sp.]
MNVIDAINREQRLAVTDNGEICQITILFDRDGDETDDAGAAVAAVIKLSDNEWLTVDLAAFQTARMN